MRLSCPGLSLFFWNIVLTVQAELSVLREMVLLFFLMYQSLLTRRKI